MQMNFVCGTRNDTGGPRCVVCPQICSSACGAGYACDNDLADGCFKCLPGGATPVPTTVMMGLTAGLTSILVTYLLDPRLMRPPPPPP